MKIASTIRRSHSTRTRIRAHVWTRRCPQRGPTHSHLADHLFAGKRAFYTETDIPEPLNVYARTKLLAEEWGTGKNAQALLVRTNFFGWGHRLRQSFSDWIYYNLRAHTPLTMFDDVFITPIIADRLAVHVHRLLALGASGIHT